MIAYLDGQLALPQIQQDGVLFKMYKWMRYILSPPVAEAQQEADVDLVADLTSFYIDYQRVQDAGKRERRKQRLDAFIVKVPYEKIQEAYTVCLTRFKDIKASLDIGSPTKDLEAERDMYGRRNI